jgi:hypothetical protein
LFSLYYYKGLLLLIGLIFFSATPAIATTSPALRKLSNGTAIVQFTLFSYDNIIADYYEDNCLYINHLTQLIQWDTHLSYDEIKHHILKPQFSQIADPVAYMLALNTSLHPLGYYFIDD